jgi:hypothetical protein
VAVITRTQWIGQNLKPDVQGLCGSFSLDQLHGSRTYQVSFCRDMLKINQGFAGSHLEQPMGDGRTSPEQARLVLHE